MNEETEAWDQLKDLVASQKLAVLATDLDGHPYTTLVCFASTPDLKHLLFATSRATRKFRNLQAKSLVSLLIDSRENVESDLHQALAATALGTAHEVNNGEREEFQNLFLKENPALKNFVCSPSCALVRVDVDSYYLVSHFQRVVELKP